MAKLNKPTWKQKFSDFIDRISPFDGSPLIQKDEHQELVGDDLSDSVMFSLPEVSTINSPSAAVDADFTSVERIDIDTTGSGGNDFDITLIGLSGNDTGILNIVKKSNDKFDFVNSDTLFTPFYDLDGQEGKTSITFIIRKVSGFYVVQSGYHVLVGNGDIGDDAILNSMIAAGQITSSKIGAGAVETSKIADSAITESKVGYPSLKVRGSGATNSTAGSTAGSKVVDLSLFGFSDADDYIIVPTIVTFPATGVGQFTHWISAQSASNFTFSWIQTPADGTSYFIVAFKVLEKL